MKKNYDSVNFSLFSSWIDFFLKICWDRAYTSYDLDCPVNSLRYVGAHNTNNFKNDRQIEIFIFPRFFIKMLNFNILDHIYIRKI